jgi:prephenate dehydrogenase
MLRGLPGHVGIVATHPLFGPQSARDGIGGLKVAVCPVRGDAGLRVAAFLRRTLGLRVIMTTPDAHDRELAMVQGLTHLIANVLVQMEPRPARMTTRSFELLMQGVAMVRHDAPEVFEAIERSNPYAREVRRRFFDLASRLDAELEGDGAKECRRWCGQWRGHAGSAPPASAISQLPPGAR